MKLSLKPAINRLLYPLNLRVSRAYKDRFTGLHLFSDLRVLIDRRAPVCLDVGANVGQTIKQLQQTFRDPLIYSFEPSSQTFATLSAQNFGQRVHLHNLALGRESSRREFINYHGSTLSSFLPIHPGQQNPFRTVAESRREVVPVQTVDSFLTQQGIGHVDLLKIDTQGFDLDVLEGAERSLQQGLVDYVLVEINFVQLYQGQPTAEAIFRFLRNCGLQLVDLYEKNRRQNRLAWCTALFGRDAHASQQAGPATTALGAAG